MNSIQKIEAAAAPCNLENNLLIIVGPTDYGKSGLAQKIVQQSPEQYIQLEKSFIPPSVSADDLAKNYFCATEPDRNWYRRGYLLSALDKFFVDPQHKAALLTIDDRTFFSIKTEAWERLLMMGLDRLMIVYLRKPGAGPTPYEKTVECRVQLFYKIMRNSVVKLKYEIRPLVIEKTGTGLAAGIGTGTSAASNDGPYDEAALELMSLAGDYFWALVFNF